MQPPSHAAHAASRFTVAQLFAASAKVHASRTALAWEGGSTTFAELDERTDRLAGALAGMGYVAGDRIAILSETRPEYCEVYIACAKLGVTLVTLNIRLHSDELRYCVELAEPTLLFVSSQMAPVAEEMRSHALSPGRVVSFDEVAGAGTRRTRSCSAPRRLPGTLTSIRNPSTTSSSPAGPRDGPRGR